MNRHILIQIKKHNKETNRARMSEYLLQLVRDGKQRFVPFLDWIFELKKPEILKADIIAGITVALVLIPQSMAYAQLAGLPPFFI